MMRNAATRFPRMTLACATVGFFIWPCFADWRQFRGNDSSSVAKDADLPVEWVDGAPLTNIAWKIELPGMRCSSAVTAICGRSPTPSERTRYARLARSSIW
jgi:hypothetical protein